MSGFVPLSHGQGKLNLEFMRDEYIAVSSWVIMKRTIPRTSSRVAMLAALEGNIKGR
jgi:hypothetical protein